MISPTLGLPGLGIFFNLKRCNETELAEVYVSVHGTQTTPIRRQAYGFLDPWFPGFLESWIPGDLDSWISGVLDSCIP